MKRTYTIKSYKAVLNQGVSKSLLNHTCMYMYNEESSSHEVVINNKYEDIHIIYIYKVNSNSCSKS